MKSIKLIIGWIFTLLFSLLLFTSCERAQSDEPPIIGDGHYEKMLPAIKASDMKDDPKWVEPGNVVPAKGESTPVPGEAPACEPSKFFLDRYQQHYGSFKLPDNWDRDRILQDYCGFIMLRTNYVWGKNESQHYLKALTNQRGRWQI